MEKENASAPVSGRRYGGWISVTGGVLLFFFLLVFGGEWWLEGKIRRVLTDGESGIARGYLTEVGRVDVSLLGRKVALRDLSVRSAAEDTAVRTSIDAKVGKVMVAGVGFKRKGGKYSVNVRRLELLSPHITVGNNRTDGRPEKDSAASLSSRITGVVSSLTVNDIRIEEGQVSYLHRRDGKETEFTGRSLNLGIADFRIDSLSAENLFRHSGIKLLLNNFSLRMDDKVLVLGIDSIGIDSKSGTLSVASVSLLPGISKYDYAANVAGHPDWTQLTADGIACFGLDYDGLIFGKKLIADSIVVDKADIQSYKNRQVAQTPETKGLVWKSVQELPLRVDIPVIRIGNTDIAYEELSKTGTSPGLVTMKDVSGKFLGLTNIAKEGNPHFTLDVTGMLYGKAHLETSFRFPLDPADDHVVVDGSMGPMELSEMNRMIMPLVHIELKSGTMNGISFHLEGTSMGSHSTVEFLYKGLEVFLVREEGGETVERKFLSEIIKDFVVKADNPDGRGTRAGTGTFERDPYKSQYNYLWKSIFEGAKDVVLRTR